VSIGLLLDMAASGYGGRIALGSRTDGVSFAELARRAAGGASVAAQHGPGQLVFVGRNGPAFPQLLFSAALAGIPFSPLNYRLSKKGLADLVEQLDNPLLVADADYLPALLGHPNLLSTEQFLAAAAAAAADPADPVPVDARDPAVLLFTSGTTAKPKAVILRHENLVSYILSTVEFGVADPEDATLVAVPPYHIAAVGSALSNLYAGRRVVYLPDFDAAQWLQAVRSERISAAMVVPTMLARIAEHLDGVPADTPSLKLISYGGARMPRPVLEKALDAFGDTGFCNAYGLTETSSTLALLGPEEHREALASDDPVVRERLGSVGRPVPGVEIKVTGPDGQELPPGEIGRLWVRGAQVSGQYVGQGSSLDAEGWFDTRDDGRVDAEDYLYIHGRADDTIIRGGENIAPAEIEDVLHAHPSVKDVAVIGRPDDEWGERIVAVVVPTPGAELTDEEIRSYVRSRLRSSRTPDEVVWRTGELPYTPTGKLLRRQLVDELKARFLAVQRQQRRREVSDNQEGDRGPQDRATPAQPGVYHRSHRDQSRAGGCRPALRRRADGPDRGGHRGRRQPGPRFRYRDPTR
jgi:acyl-CoA synthetase (AMP-forming)/AMP-acid ligase II